MTGERWIEMTPARVERMMGLADLGVMFAEDPLRMRFLAAKILARAVTDDEIFTLVQEAAFDEFPVDEPPVNGRPA